MPMPAQVRRDERSRAAAAPLALSAVSMLLLCVACSKPQPPETDRPPEPQAGATQGTDQGAAATGAADATGLRDAIQQPIDRARAVDAQVEDAAAKQRAAVDAQSGY